VVGLYLLITNIYTLSTFVNFGEQKNTSRLYYQKMEHGLASDHEVRRRAGNILAKVDGTEGLLLRSYHWHHGKMEWKCESISICLSSDPEYNRR
jgi:hypothetical protein